MIILSGNILPIPFHRGFLNGACILHFLGQTKSTINYSNLKYESGYLQKKEIELHFTLQIFCIQLILIGRNGGYLDRGRERGEIPYNPIDMTSRTISQPKMHLPHQEVEKELLEYQQAY